MHSLPVREIAIRGPGNKIDLDVRRVWRCPDCGYERRALGDRTTIRCRCGERTFMKLVSEPVFRRPANRPVDVYFDAEAEAGLEPVEAGGEPAAVDSNAAAALAEAAVAVSTPLSEEPPRLADPASEPATPPADPLPDDDHPPPLATPGAAADLSAASNPGGGSSPRENRGPSKGRRNPKSRGRRRGGSPPAGQK